MYLLRKILSVFGGMDIPFLKKFNFQVRNAQPVVFKRSKSIFAVLLLGVGFFGMSCASSTSDENRTKLEFVEPQATSTTPVKHVVTIKDMKYNPAITRANIGDTILFTNKDLVPHNVADSLTKEWLSPQLNLGDEWSIIVSKNLHFYCAFHPNMEGDIQLGAPLNAQKSK